MANKTKINQLVNEALTILEACGIPLDGLTERRKTKMAKAFLALANVRPNVAWNKAKSNEHQHRYTSREIIAYMNEFLGENIADSSYDDIRRKDLILPVTAGLIMKSAADPNADTNDGTRGYALRPEFATQVRLFGTAQWKNALSNFLAGQTTLAEKLRRERQLAQIPVTIGNGTVLKFSPGPHNDLQKQIIEVFLPNFGYGAEVLYVGDTAEKLLFIDKEKLAALNFFELAHDQLPDVIAYSPKKNWVFLIEAVHSANPITELRRLTLQKVAADCKADIVFVTAFPDRTTFRKHVKDVAWETEVWIADAPEHLIDFNGDKFLGPYKD